MRSREPTAGCWRTATPTNSRSRSGDPVPIAVDTVVWVRTHMNTSGYGDAVFKDSPASGFVRADWAPSFAADLARQPPLPDGCAF